MLLLLALPVCAAMDGEMEPAHPHIKSGADNQGRQAFRVGAGIVPALPLAPGAA